MFNLCIVKEIIEQADKKEQILTVAEDLFSQQDFDAVSVRDLAKAANVNIAMISYYFGSKEKLFETLILGRIDASQGSLKDIVGSNKPVLEKMYDIIDFYVDKFSTNVDFQKMINRELSIDTRPRLRDLIITKIKENKELTKKMLEEEAKKGTISDKADIQMTMLSFFATMHKIAGAPYYSCQILEKNNTEELNTPEFRDRIRTYFKSIIKNQLLIK